METVVLSVVIFSYSKDQLNLGVFIILYESLNFYYFRGVRARLGTLSEEKSTKQKILNSLWLLAIVVLLSRRLRKSQLFK